MLRKLLFFILFLSAQKGMAQTHLDQNGIQTSVIGLVATDDATRKFLIAEIGYNSYHWQYGGAVIIELFSPFYSTSYQRYVVEVGYGRGTTGSEPLISFKEGYGYLQSAKIEMGTPVALGTANGGYDNFSLPIYLNLKYYSYYRVKITYMRQRVEQLTDVNQIKLYTSPTGNVIDDFSPPQVDVNVESIGNLQIGKETSTHYLLGNVGIGTTTPQEKLAVNGKIRAKEIKVEVANWPDYVFKSDYEQMTLPEVEAYIKANGHLPEMPSAKEVAQDGVALGEMNKLLLKKVEELTLHLIEMKKELAELKASQGANKN